MDPDDADNLVSIVEAKLAPTWDPEEPEGFAEWWNPRCLAVVTSKQPLASEREEAIEVWNACLAHSKAQRQEKPWFDGMSFEEIAAHLETGTFPGAMTPGSWVRVPSDFMVWMTKKGRQEAQERPIEVGVDPEARRKEIDLLVRRLEVL